MKKVNKTKLIGNCDKVYSLIVRSKGYCEKCGKPDSLNTHHIIHRTNKWLRFDLRNGCCLCVGCHIFGPESAHHGEAYFMEWFRNYRPDDLEYLLDPKWKITKVWSIYDYQQIYGYLKTLYKEVTVDL